MSKKKSLFVKNLKTFKSDFTGEEKSYKINNALWVFMERDFGLSQLDWSEKYDERKAYYGSIFATCLLNANGHEVTLDEVIENTDIEDIEKLMLNYIESLYEGMDGLDLHKDNDDDKELPS